MGVYAENRLHMEKSMESLFFADRTDPKVGETSRTNDARSKVVRRNQVSVSKEDLRRIVVRTQKRV
jgi:hypothetical protein